MTPTAPKKRTPLRAKASQSGSGLIARPPVHREGAVISDNFINSKKDKLTIKRHAFLSRIEKGHKKPLKRRRPNKKLATTLEGLADALPDVEELIQGQIQGQDGKIKVQSLKSKPGALKRKEKLEKMERERFGLNLAQIMAVKETPTPTVMATETAQTSISATSSRFAALRAWAEANMEKHPGFNK